MLSRAALRGLTGAVPRAARGAALALAAIALAAPVARAAPAPGAVVLDGLVFLKHGRRVEIPHLEAAGSSLSADELRAVLDPDSGLTLDQRFARVTATTIAVPTLTWRGPEPTDGTERAVVVARDVVLRDVRAGKVGRVTLGGIEARFASAPTEHDHLTVGPIGAEAVDPTLAQAILAGPRTDRDLPLGTLLGSLTAGPIAFDDGAGTAFAVARVASGGVEGRPLLAAPKDLVDAVPHFKDAVPPENSLAASQALVDAASSFHLARLAVEGVRVSGGPGRSFALGALRVEELRGTAVGLIGLDDASLAVDGTEMSLARFALTGIDRKNALGVAAARLLGLPAAALDLSAPAAPERLLLEGLRFVIRPTDDGSPFPPGTAHTVAVPRFEISEAALPNAAGVETRSSFALDYAMPATGDDPTLRTVRALGLDRLALRVASRAVLDAAAHAFRLDEFSVGDARSAEMTLSARVDDLPEPVIDAAAPPDRPLERYMDATFRSMRLRLADHGLTARALPLMARMSGTSPALFKAALKTQAELFLAQALGPTPLEARLLATFSGFVDRPGTVLLSVAAPRGLSMRAIADAPGLRELVSQLDITVERSP